MAFGSHTLVLNADFYPLKIITWQQAILLYLEEKSDIIEAYPGLFIRSAHTSVPWPSVIRLRKYVKTGIRLRFNRRNLLARDHHECCYCGIKPTTESGKPNIKALTLDHVIPRAQSKDGIVIPSKGPNKGKEIALTSWSNVVCACIPCNTTKADRTPEQAGMKLRKLPQVPSPRDSFRISLSKVTVPREWEQYL